MKKEKKKKRVWERKRGMRAQRRGTSRMLYELYVEYLS